MGSIDIISRYHVHATVYAISLSVTDGRIAEDEMETLSDGRQVRRWMQMGCGHFSETSACQRVEKTVLSVSNSETTICVTCSLCGFRALHNIERHFVDAQGIAHLCHRYALRNRLLDRPRCFKNAPDVKQDFCCSMFTLRLLFVWFVCTAAVVGSMTAIACSSMQCSKIRPAVVAFSILFLLGMFSLIAAILCIKDKSAVEMIGERTSQHHESLGERDTDSRRGQYHTITENTTLTDVHIEDDEDGWEEADVTAADDDDGQEEAGANETLDEIPPSYENLMNDLGGRVPYDVVMNVGAAEVNESV